MTWTDFESKLTQELGDFAEERGLDDADLFYLVSQVAVFVWLHFGLEPDAQT